MDESPLVSAVVTTHNRPKLLRRALDSVAAQTYSNLELIVVDDASEPDVQAIVEQYAKALPVQYIRNEASLGACRARNKGFEAAAGTFIAGLDDDDKWHKERITALVDAYSDEYACVTSDTVMAYPQKEAVWKKKKIIDLDTLLFTNQVGNQVLVRKDRLLEIGGFDPDLKAAQDYDLWIRLCQAYGPIKNVQKPLQTVYMNHEAGRITTLSAFEGYLQFYAKHKHQFNRKQQKYQLFKIRRAQGKPMSLGEFINCVPTFRYWKEIKHILIRTFFE